MFTFVLNKIKNFVFFAPAILVISCTVTLRHMPFLYPNLQFAALNSVSLYTCNPLTLSAVTDDGSPFVSKTNLSISLTGLGQGSAYSSLSDCQSGTNNTTSLFLSADTSQINFYYRTTTAENVTLVASTGTGIGASLPLAAVPFQVLGQPSGTRLVQKEKGESYPESAYSNGTYLYVVDSSNNRVLGWRTLPTSNQQPPDFVLGQPDLQSTSMLSPTGTTLYTPTSVTSDGTRLLVTDQGNNRILVWNTFPTTTGSSADFAIGQADLLTRNSGTSATRLMQPTSAFTDGTRLYVADYMNSRVLVWNTMPSSSGQAADFALGQPDLISNSFNNGGLSGSRLFYPMGVWGNGTRLFVVDMGNNRILGWNSLPSSNVSADFVLGQPDLVSNTVNNGGVSATSLASPYGCSSDGTKFFVADTGNHRVLIWNSLPTSTAQPASLAVGQSNLTSRTIGTSSTGLNFPNYAYHDGTRFYVADKVNNRTLVWNSVPSSSGQAADLVLGQPDFTSSSTNNAGMSSSIVTYPRGSYSDGTRLFLVDGSRVLMWNTIPTSDNQAADLVLGQADFSTNTSNFGGLSGSSIWSANGIFSDGTHLIVADSSNNRVLIWNSMPTTNNQSADVVLGQPNFVSNTSNNGGVSASSLNGPNSVFSDGSRLYVVDSSNNRVLIWNSSPTVNNQAADFVLGQPDFVSNSSNNGGISGSSLGYPTSAYSDGTHLFVVDTSNRRVLVWNTSPSVNNQSADFALGQPDFVTVNYGTSESLLTYPLSIHGDGTRIFVTDYTSNRILIWNSLPTAFAQTADSVIGQPDFVSGTANNGGFSATSLNSPTSVFSDGSRVFISDRANFRVIITPIPGI